MLSEEFKENLPGHKKKKIKKGINGNSTLQLRYRQNKEEFCSRSLSTTLLPKWLTTNLVMAFTV